MKTTTAWLNGNEAVGGIALDENIFPAFYIQPRWGCTKLYVTPPGVFTPGYAAINRRAGASVRLCQIILLAQADACAWFRWPLYKIICLRCRGP